MLVLFVSVSVLVEDKSPSAEVEVAGLAVATQE